MQSVIIDDLAYVIDGNGLFSWADPEAAGRTVRLCPMLEEAGPDRHGRPREGDRVQAGADVLPLAP